MGIVIESQTFIGVARGGNGARAQVWLPPGFTLTGGGVYDTGSGKPSVLSASCPVRDEDGHYTGWMAAGTALPDAPLAVYAVGIRIVKDGVPVRVEQQVFCATSALASDPGVTVRLGAGWIGTGGGAQDNHAIAVHPHAETVNYPLLGAAGQVLGWSASTRTADAIAQARVSAFVVGIRTSPQVAIDAATLAACLRPSFPATPVTSSASATGPVAAGGRVYAYGQSFAARRGAVSAAMLEAA